MSRTSRPLEITVPVHGADAVSCLRWSEDGEQLVVGLLDGDVHVVAGRGDGAARPVAHHPRGVRCVGWATDSTLATAGHDGRLLIGSDGDDPVEVDLGQWPSALAWSGGEIAIAAGADVAVHRRDGSLVRRWPLLPGTVHAVVWSHALRLVIAGGVGGIRALDPTAASIDAVWEAPWTGAVLAMALHPRHDAVAVADLAGEIRVVPLGGEEETVLSGYPERVSTVAWCDGGRALAAEAADEVTVWAVDAECEPAARPRHLLRHPDAVTSLAPAPRSALLAVGDIGGEVRVWDVADGCPVAAIHAPGPVTALAWAPDGHAVAVGTGDGAAAVARLI